MCTDKSMDILPECSSVSRRKMITKKEILDAIHGKMIISCQAVEDEPLYVEEKSIMYLMARAAKQAGTPAIRTSSIRDVIAIKEETGLPVIGLVKIQYPGYEGYITPTMKEVDDLVAAGSDVVALDCTLRKRGDGSTVNEFIAQIKEKYPDIILMDEPASALDPIATARIEELIDELRNQYCIVIVTHSMAQAARVSQRTAFFHMGRLVETGDTEDIFQNPRERRTLDYITGRFG